jgi:hypothetical protein
MGTGRVAVSISEAEKIAARKIVRDHIHTVLDFGRRAGVYWLMDGIDDIVDAALEAAARARWQPIETAPKDGTQILIYDFEVGFRVAEWMPIVFGGPKGHWYSGGNIYVPAHWQPLPSPLESKT